MQNLKCLTCNVNVSVSAIFCHNCGKRLKCKACNADLLKDAKFCISCGESVESKLSPNDESKNTAKYHRKGDDIFCEVSLNNEVAKEGIMSLFDNLAGNQRSQYKKLANGSEPAFSNTQTEVVEDIEDENGIPEQKGSIQENDSREHKNPSEDLPHINDVEMNLECSERDWILIYAFYLSDFGKNNFTKKIVYERYMSKRRTNDRVKNFAIYWKRLFRHYLSTVNNEEIKFKKESIPEVRNLIVGQKKSHLRSGKNNSSNKAKKKTDADSTTASANKISKKVGSQSQSYSLITELNLIPKGLQSLKDFYSNYAPNSNLETILIIVYYLQKILNEKNINENSLYTSLKFLHLPVPNLRQTLNNIHSRKGWINTASFNDLKITVSGENYLEHEMVKSK